MDEKGRALQGRLDFCERNVKALQNGVKGLIKNHQGACRIRSISTMISDESITFIF